MGHFKRPTSCIYLYQPCPESFSLGLLFGDCTIRIVVCMTVLLMTYCVMYNLGVNYFVDVVWPIGLPLELNKVISNKLFYILSNYYLTVIQFCS